VTKERNPDELRGRCAEARDSQMDEADCRLLEAPFSVTDERAGISSVTPCCCPLYLLALSVALGYSVVDKCHDLRRAEDASHLFILAGRF